jgi:hypothetical protein
VLLKEVFDYPLAERSPNSRIQPSTASRRRSSARTKLAALPDDAGPVSTVRTDRQRAELLRLYVERFNWRDWDGVRELSCASTTASRVAPGSTEALPV